MDFNDMVEKARAQTRQAQREAARANTEAEQASKAAVGHAAKLDSLLTLAARISAALVRAGAAPDGNVLDSRYMDEYNRLVSEAGYSSPYDSKRAKSRYRARMDRAFEFRRSHLIPAWYTGEKITWQQASISDMRQFDEAWHYLWLGSDGMIHRSNVNVVHQGSASTIGILRANGLPGDAARNLHEIEQGLANLVGWRGLSTY